MLRSKTIFHVVTEEDIKGNTDLSVALTTGAGAAVENFKRSRENCYVDIVSASITQNNEGNYIITLVIKYDE